MESARDRLGVRRGTEATWQSPGGPHEAQAALTRGRRPRGRRVGRHVWLDLKGDMTILTGESVPLFNHKNLPIFLPCGTMFPHGFTLQATWTCGERRIQAQTGDRVDPSPRDPSSKHVLKKRV